MRIGKLIVGIVGACAAIGGVMALIAISAGVATPINDVDETPTVQLEAANELVVRCIISGEKEEYCLNLLSVVILGVQNGDL